MMLGRRPFLGTVVSYRWVYGIFFTLPQPLRIGFIHQEIFFVGTRFCQKCLSAVFLWFNSCQQNRRDDVRAQTVPGHCCFLQMSVWPFLYLATTTCDNVCTLRKIFSLEVGFCQLCFSAVFLGFHSCYQKHSDDFRAQTVPGHCCFWQISVWHFLYLPQPLVIGFAR